MNLAGFVTMGLGLLATVAVAAPPETESAPASAEVGAAAPAVAGGLIFALPDEEARTDELVGELLLDPAVREALRTDWDGLVEELQPDGSVKVDLRGRFQNVVVARLADGGGLRLDHVAQPNADPPPRPVEPARENGLTADAEVRP